MFRTTGVVASLVLATAFMCPQVAGASGHGPVFGGAPPTLGKGTWQLDQAWMGRVGHGHSDDDQMLRTMLSLGITQDLQISASLPITLESGIYMPRGRTMAMMSSNQDFEAIAGWRFQRRAVGAGARLESTLFVGGTVPMQKYRSDGMLAAPSVEASVASGFASRAHYFWAGGGYQYFGEREGDQMGDSVYYSAVYGYRPPFLRVDYPKPDLRFFVEAIGEHSARGKHHGFEMVVSGGDSILIGPSALLLYKQYGFEAGMLFPVYQQTNFQPDEKFRFGVNFTYFFWRK
jgi:hypothetical protein